MFLVMLFGVGVVGADICVTDLTLYTNLKLDLNFFLYLFLNTLYHLLYRLRGDHLTFTLFVLYHFHFLYKLVLLLNDKFFFFYLDHTQFGVDIGTFGAILGNSFVGGCIGFIFFRSYKDFLNQATAVFVGRLCGFLITLSRVLNGVKGLSLGCRVASSSLASLFT